MHQIEYVQKMIPVYNYADIDNKTKAEALTWKPQNIKDSFVRSFAGDGQMVKHAVIRYDDDKIYEAYLEHNATLNFNAKDNEIAEVLILYLADMERVDDDWLDHIEKFDVFGGRGYEKE